MPFAGESINSVYCTALNAHSVKKIARNAIMQWLGGGETV